MNENQKNYYAIIPANVRYDKRLKANAKLLYGELTALANQKGYSWAGNGYYAELYNVSKETISRWLRQLKEFGYIQIEYIYKENSKEIDQRNIYINTVVQKDENVNTPIDEKVINPLTKKSNPLDEKIKDNITVNTTYNNIYSKSTVRQKEKTASKEYMELFNMWVSNNLTNHKIEIVVTKETKKIKDLINLYGTKEISLAIINYSKVLKSDKYYYSHKFTFWDFLTRALDKFVDESDPLNNFLDNKHKQEKPKKKQVSAIPDWMREEN